MYANVIGRGARLVFGQALQRGTSLSGLIAPNVSSRATRERAHPLHGLRVGERRPGSEG